MVVEGLGALAGGDRVQELERAAVVASRLVHGDAARVERQLGPPRDVHPAVKGDLDCKLRARPVHAAGRRYRGPRGGRRRQPDELHAAVAAGGHGGVRAAVQVKGGDIVRLAERVKDISAGAGHPVGGRPGRQERAVVVYVYELDGAAGLGRHDGVRVAVGAVEHGDPVRAAERVEPAGAVEGGVDGLQRAVVVHADQLGGAAAVALGDDHCVRVVAHPEHVHAAAAAERIKPAGAVGRRHVRPQPAVVVHAEQLDAVIVVRCRDQGVGAVADRECVDVPGPEARAGNGRRHAGAGRQGAVVAVDADDLDLVGRKRCDHGVRPAVARYKGVDARGGAQAKVAAVGCVARGREGAVVVHAQQLDGRFGASCHDRKRLVAQPEGGDIHGSPEQQAAAVGRVARGREGAVILVHAQQLDGVVAGGGGDHVRGAAHGERVGALGHV